MTININLELELTGIIGPFKRHGVGKTIRSKFYIIVTIKRLGLESGAVVFLTDTSLEVSTLGGNNTDPRNTLEALIVQQLLENLQKEAKDSVEANLAGLWTDGYINITPEESELIKNLIVEKSERLLEED